MASTSSSGSTGANDAVYTEALEWFYGMNARTIDIEKGLELLASLGDKDPVALALRACHTKPPKVADALWNQASGTTSPSLMEQQTKNQHVLYVQGVAYQEGKGNLTKDPTKAFQCYKLAADQSHVSALNNLGYIYRKGLGVAENFSEALKYFQMAAKRGHAGAQRNVAGMHIHAQGVEQSYDEAKKYIQMAADQGDSEAHFLLGVMYNNGEGVEQSDTEALKYVQMAVDKGNANALFYLGYMYSCGGNVEQNDMEAARYYRLAADQGNAQAQRELGNLYHLGVGVCQSDAEGTKYFQMAVDQGDQEAQRTLGWKYENGENVAQNDTEAAKYYRLAAEQGDADAHLSLGNFYKNGRGVAQSDTEAVNHYQLAAEQNCTESLRTLADFYKTGRGVMQSDTEAVRYYQLAADLSDTNSLRILGDFYKTGGCGVTQSDTEAFKYYQRAADLWDKESQRNVGEFFKTGRGVTQSDDDAVKYFQQAADQGDAESQRNLGDLYRTGRGVTQSDDEAVKYFQQAANQGDAESQRNLGDFYRTGRGVAQSDTSAVEYYQLAANQGDEEARKTLESFNSNIRKRSRTEEDDDGKFMAVDKDSDVDIGSCLPFYLLQASPDEETYDSEKGTVVYTLSLKTINEEAASKSLLEYLKHRWKSGHEEGWVDSWCRHQNDMDEDEQRRFLQSQSLPEFIDEHCRLERNAWVSSETCVVFGETREFEEEWAFFTARDVKADPRRLGYLLFDRVRLHREADSRTGQITEIVVLLNDRIEGSAGYPRYQNNQSMLDRIAQAKHCEPPKRFLALEENTFRDNLDRVWNDIDSKNHPEMTTRMEITIASTFAGFSPDSLQRFNETMRGATNIKSLDIFGYGYELTLVEPRVFIQIIKALPANIKAMRLSRLCPSAGIETPSTETNDSVAADLELLAKILPSNLSTLERIEFLKGMVANEGVGLTLSAEDFSSHEDGDDETSTRQSPAMRRYEKLSNSLVLAYRKVFGAFASIPSLQKFSLHQFYNQNFLRRIMPLSAVQQLGQSRTLQVLNLSIPLNDEQILAFCNSASTSANYIIEENALSKLKTVDILLDHPLNNPEGCGIAMGTLLKSTKSIQAFRVGTWGQSLSEDTLLPIFEGVRHNSTVEDLYLAMDYDGLSVGARQTLMEMIQHNYFLKDFRLYTDDNFMQKVYFYLSLNRAGRGSLLQQGESLPTSTPEHWLDVIGSVMVREDVSFIFYFLTHNPMLCDVSRRHHGREA